MTGNYRQKGSGLDHTCICMYYLDISLSGKRRGIWSHLDSYRKFYVSRYIFFWQSKAIVLSVRVGLMRSTDNYSFEETAVIVQDYLIYFEIIIAATIHFYIYFLYLILRN
jgi:hypothetical protein